MEFPFSLFELGSFSDHTHINNIRILIYFKPRFFLLFIPVLFNRTFCDVEMFSSLHLCNMVATSHL